jgi:hypothetical protein
MSRYQNEQISLTFDLQNGINITSIYDKVTHHEFLIRPTFLFEFASNNRTPYRSNNGIILDDHTVSSNGSLLTLVAHASNEPLAFSISITVPRDEPAAILRMNITNTGSSKVFLRTVFPKIQGLVTPGAPSKMMGMIPQEIGSVVPLQLAPHGAKLAVAKRVVKRNDIDVIQQDVFVVGNDGAIWTTYEVDNGPWSSPVRLTRADLAPPGASIAAVRRNNRQEDVFVVGNDGAIWTIFEVDNGPWQQPIRIRNGNFKPGASIAAVRRNNRQEDVFVVGNDGAIWTTYEVNDSPWAAPIRIGNSSSIFSPGASIAAVRRNNRQEDVFAIGTDGAICTTYEVNDSPWVAPIVISGHNLVPNWANIEAIMRNDVQQDVFVVGNDGAIWTTYEVNDSPWAAPISLAGVLGMSLNIGIGLPTAMNTMEVASVYDGDNKGGLFFADIEGELDRDIAPIQFNLSSSEVAGFWVDYLEPRQTANVPGLAIGVNHIGNWHPAVDYYTNGHAKHWKFPKIPAWFRDQGAIYTFSNGGAGGIYLDPYMGWKKFWLKDRIRSFNRLPDLLAEAQQLGTNIVYLWDYWQGQSDSDSQPYFLKGDYTPRADMGGPDGFRQGIRLIHERGGKVIVYVESFIISRISNIGRQKGWDWHGYDDSGQFAKIYCECREGNNPPASTDCYKTQPECYDKMVAPYKPWQDHLVRIAQQLVRDYDVDGIFLDSCGWQMNWPVKVQETGAMSSSKQYSQGVLKLVDRVREAIQEIKPDAVVIGETTIGQLGQHWDGGLSADFAWYRWVNQERIIASPVRYGIPEINYISNGTNLNELNQIYAAGHSLALCSNWPDDIPNFIKDNAAYIHKLVTIRQRYKDALIYGMQTYQPKTDSDNNGSSRVIAYYYQGKQNEIITAVNIAATDYSGNLLLEGSEDNNEPKVTIWKDLLKEEDIFQTQRGQAQLPITIAANHLRVLVRM